MSTNATIASLPAELIAEIFTRFQHKKCFYDLCRFALVCRSWRELAQQALFSAPFLHDESRAKAWLEAPARYRYHVNFLYVHLRNDVLQSEVQEACHGLESLDLIVPIDFDGGFKWLAGQQANSLKSLRIACPELFPEADHPLQLRVHHLNLLVNHGVTLEPHQINTILRSSRESLVSLELKFYGHTTTVTRLRDFFAAERFNSLRHLTLCGRRLNGMNDSIVMLVPLLPALESLTLESFDPASVAAVGASATAGLKTLTLGHEISWDFVPEKLPQDKIPLPFLAEILRILRLPNLAGLRRLSLPWPTQSDFLNEEGLALLEECKMRSISFLSRSGYLTRDMVAGSA
ncbi:hypothetical protein RQP46_002879 [Phenoliferia psychrophenolica]